MAKRDTAKRAEWIAEAMEHVRQARIALLAQHYAELRDDTKRAKELDRETRRHLQVARRLIDRAGKLK